MMAAKMTLQKAREIAHAVSIGRAKFGAQFKPSYPESDLLEALAVMESCGKWDALDPTELLLQAKEAVTAANRRAGAAEARLKRCMKGDKTLLADTSNDTLRQED